MILISNDFCHKIKYNVLLSIATNIAVLLMTAFVLQAHNPLVDMLSLVLSIKSSC